MELAAPDSVWPGSNGRARLRQQLWKWDVTLYESVPAIRAARQRAGRPYEDGSVLSDVVQSIAPDVVDAAGGVEFEYERFRASLADAEAACAELITKSREGITPETLLSVPQLEDAAYILDDLFVWVRRLDDRLRRRPQPGGGCDIDQGLIPALTDGPRREAIIRAKSRLTAALLDEARHLVNLSLHMKSMEAGSKVGALVDSRLVIPFPDRVTNRINHRWELTYDHGCDAATVADQAMGSVERFMDEMIAALEHNIPARFT